jgi:hypothetical protein
MIPRWYRRGVAVAALGVAALARAETALPVPSPAGVVGSVESDDPGAETRLGKRYPVSVPPEVRHELRRPEPPFSVAVVSPRPPRGANRLRTAAHPPGGDVGSEPGP